ncbi:uncharacterized protein LOC114942420 [Nylanderia fulva]|uniref:uncharacterized protein LOC114942420 n=1 Tax=Nylanderia fulva TaxID=613905 RepID=UPI0010FB5F8E|nr:uncharacterized protein LOC114942420 [Nylanderia fulva]
MRAFVRNIFDMAFLFLIQGFGMGLIITVCYTVFNAYFVKKRTKVMSVAQVFIALGGIIYPKLIGKLKIVYDFRGTAAIIGAISLNGIIGMALMHPVERHLKNIDVVRAEKAREKEEKCQELALSSQRHSTISGIESEINERSESVSMRENLTRRMSTLSASSVANLATSVGALSDIRQQYLKEQILEDQTNKETLKERENEKETPRKNKRSQN